LDDGKRIVADSLVAVCLVTQPREVLDKYIEQGIVDYRDKSDGPGGTSRLQRIWLNECLREITQEGSLRDKGIRWVILADMGKRREGKEKRKKMCHYTSPSILW